MNTNQKNKWTEEQAVSALRRWCAVQDRCQNEVRTKLIDHQVYGDILERIISQLISEGFINEERFARNYVRGKFRMTNWGRNKIMQGLKMHNISPYCIKRGFLEIDEEEYEEILKKLLSKKWNQLGNKKTPDTRKKLFSYGFQKGYESEIIQRLTSKIMA